MNSQQERLRRTQGSPPVRVALLGMPNTGKSTLYNRLTGGHAQIANWPGLTVDLLQGPMAPNRNGRSYALVDLPGIHDLSGSSEDEAVAQRFLRFTPPDLLLVVINASQISTQLRLLLQLQQLGLPLMAALNMSDEAGKVVRGPAPLSLALANVQVGIDQVLLSPWSQTDFRDGSQPWWA